MQSVVRIPGSSVHQTRRPKNGFKLGFCRVCTCFNVQFLTTRCGLLKIFEIVLGSCCETLLIRFGMSAAQDIGEAFFSFHSTVSACLSTSFILFVCYFLSSKTYGLMRQSIFEIFFNAFACFLYISASCYMGWSTNVYLYPQFFSSSSSTAFPAMVCVYYVGAILGIVYGMDAFVAYKDYKAF